MHGVLAKMTWPWLPARSNVRCVLRVLFLV